MNFHDFESLLSRVCDGSADPEEISKLHEAIRSDDALLDVYLQYVDLHASLATTDLLTPLSHRSAAQARRSKKVWSRRQWLIAGSLSTAAAVVASLTWSRGSSTGSFARITQNAGAQLTRNDRSIPIGASLPAGRMRLTQGSLGVAYGAGVELVIEAPAEFECRRADLLVLHTGRLAAHVAPAGAGFTVETSNGRAVDLGTRFAIDAEPNTPAEVHVFEGKVEASARKQATAVRTLGAGEAAELAPGVANCSLRNAAFVQPEELPDVIAALKSGQPERWRQWRERTANESSTILYASLEPDRLAHGVNGDRLTRLGARAVGGRWPGKQCLEFLQKGDAVRLDVGGEKAWPQVTLMAWVRLDRMGEPYQSLYHTDGWSSGKPGQIHWMITDKGSMRLAIRNNSRVGDPKDPKAGWPDSDSLPGILPERGRWVHLAATYDSDAGRVRFYFDGVPAGEVMQKVAHPALLGPARVGNWDMTDRKLSGRVDEFVMVGRAMSEAEILDAYNAGTPYQLAKT